METERNCVWCGVEKKRAEATQQQQIDGGNGKLHWASPK